MTPSEKDLADRCASLEAAVLDLLQRVQRLEAAEEVRRSAAAAADLIGRRAA